jgi:hypothetical protein
MMDPRASDQVDPRASLALWLRAGRADRRLTLEEVAKITKIQPRILEKLENGELDGLPAEVFVRGFVRSFARCVGLDETEALERLGDCRGVTKAAPPVVRALVQSMAQIAPVTARATAPVPAPLVGSPIGELVVSEPVIEVVVEAPVAAAESVPAAESASDSGSLLASGSESIAAAVEPIALDAPKKKRTRKKPAGTTPPRPRKRKKDATVEPIQLAEGSAPVETALEVAAPAAGAEVVALEIVQDVAVEPETVVSVDSTTTTSADSSEPWTPTMPAIVAPSVPWRRPAFAAVTTTAPPAPSLVIDDADPDRAEREQTQRSRDHRVSFLPPILLDRDDRSQRQGGLTLAVIILLIAATLTLSYLMRRPAVTGDGVTMQTSPTALHSATLA